MNYKLSEVLDSIDFYGSTLNKASWYPSNASYKKDKAPRVGAMGKKTRKRQKSHDSI